MAEHLQAGYLEKPFDTTDLAHGIDLVLNASSYNGLLRK